MEMTRAIRWMTRDTNSVIKEILITGEQKDIETLTRMTIEELTSGELVAGEHQYLSEIGFIGKEKTREIDKNNFDWSKFDPRVHYIEKENITIMGE